MRHIFAFLALVTALFVVRTGRADEAKPALPTVDLYTIGPSNDFPSRFGHALLCVRPAGKDVPESGQCYDYGVPPSDDLTGVVAEMLRDVPSFIVVRIDEARVIAFFEDQGRAVEKQRLPLSADQTTKLALALERDVAEKKPYAYHPYWANCTTKVRDRIDEATDGGLRPGASTIPPGTMVEYMEEGHSGHLGILTAMAIYLGEGGNQHVPTPWEAMLLPSVLRDTVTERFHVPPEQLAERMAVILPTSRAIGRMTVFALAFLLFVAVRIASKRNRLRLALGLIGGTFGALAISMELFSALVKWPEISHNWALLLIWPTDLALPWLKGRVLSLYLKVRVAVAVVFAVLEIASVAHQPLLHLVALVALPCLGLLGALKERESTKENDVPTESAKAA